MNLIDWKVYKMVYYSRSEGFLFDGELEGSLGVVSFPEICKGDLLILSWHISELCCSFGWLYWQDINFTSPKPVQYNTVRHCHNLSWFIKYSQQNNLFWLWLPFSVNSTHLPIKSAKIHLGILQTFTLLLYYVWLAKANIERKEDFKIPFLVFSFY